MTKKILIVSDGKLGHVNQMLGIASCLKKKYGIDYEIQTIKNMYSTMRSLYKKNSYFCIIGAGHATHFILIMSRLFFNQKIVCLMKPTLPCFLFNMVIAPAHDSIASSDNVILTKGVPNKIVFKEKKSCTGLLLIGGPSKSNDWPEDLIFKQIDNVMRDKTVSWKILDSPRTPLSTKKYFQENYKSNYHSVDIVSSDTLPDLLSVAVKCWVTEDSASMVYESLTAGCKTGILSVNASKKNKVIRGVDALHSAGIVTRYPDLGFSKLKFELFVLNEADRCADIIANKFVFGF
ncbi:ELM1/GtrOC1 family putative glycosyltransferase [Methylotuvimicrobium buryatense]|uniref:Nucleoside-diphosphate sugar epimerase n=1 Tax=Methylotuvimicrobium buryatense TaxID=95641 RepID=A0A4P9UTR1_METBY|nr:ELM1/GtrOC1 family putative glycosyltransferase [Methylotuvimicrobium buryatense]QCW84010.1 hypothetical protein EQU24_18505 [Methylotuvimicrobium buryatense]